MMSERDRIIADTLAGTRWADWARNPIAGDASARRYLRLRHGTDSVIVMDAPPKVCKDTAQFLKIAHTLGSAGLAAPMPLLTDLDAGVLVLSDLGPTDFATHLLQSPQEEATLYAAAVSVLVEVAQIASDPALPRLTPEHGAAMLEPLGTRYVDGDISDLQRVMLQALSDHAPVADTLSLRDFHAENLIWRADLTGTARVGLLDFQDAFVAPAGYDLASLLRDARRDVSGHTQESMIALYAKSTGTPITAFSAQVAVLGVQRNLRIMGVFARLATEQGKRRYLQFMDRLWRHIQADLAHPALNDLRKAVNRTVPPPTPDHLQRLQP